MASLLPPVDESPVDELERTLLTLQSCPSWPGFALGTISARTEVGQGAVVAKEDEEEVRLVEVLEALLYIASLRRRNCVAMRMAGALPGIVAVARDRRATPRVHSIVLRLLAVLCKDPVCCEEVGWLGGHHLFMREIMDGSEEAEAAVSACASCATLVEFPAVTKPGLLVCADERRPALTFSFENENCDAPTAWHIVLQEIPTTAADVAASDRTNMTVGYHHWDAGTALGHWVVQHANQFEGKTILEIGSGLGLPGILAAAVANTKSCTLSDFNPKIVANLVKNVDINDVYFTGLDRSAPVCTRLDWDHLDRIEDKVEDEGGGGEREGEGVKIKGKHPQQNNDESTSKLPASGSVDIMLGSDIICQDSDCIGICRALVYFLKPESGKAVFICGGTRNRYGIDKFPAACEEAGLTLDMSPVGNDILSGVAKNQTHNSRPHDDLMLFQVRLS